MSIGERIKAARKNANMTQQALADILELSASMIGQYESNLRTPKYDRLKSIAKALNVSVDMLYYGFEPDYEYEDIVDTLASANLSIEPAGFMDHYYIWHTGTDDISDDRIEIGYSKLLSTVREVQQSADQHRKIYLAKRLETELFN